MGVELLEAFEFARRKLSSSLLKICGATTNTHIDNTKLNFKNDFERCLVLVRAAHAVSKTIFSPGPASDSASLTFATCAWRL